MPTPLDAGPFRVVQAPDGMAVPYYIVPFDKSGTCTGPKTRADLLAHLDDVTDVFVFSHGWNNDWSAATERYEQFISGMQQLRIAQGIPLPVPYKPLLVGIFWPSQPLTFLASEVGPGFAGADTPADTSLVDAIAEQVPPAQRERFAALASAASLQPAEARELAGILAAAFEGNGSDEAGAPAVPTAADLLGAANALEEPEEDYDTIGTIGGPAAGDTPQAAGLGDVLRALDPRNLVKPFTVWQMKDRAGTIGARGVAPLLDDIIDAGASGLRVHVLGHSFGCKVVMTAVCRMAHAGAVIESALLLQPAISQYAFAEQVPDRNVAGGFLAARSRVRQPITCTFSTHDKPLHDMFHLSVRRKDDLGELQYAGGPPSAFAAMGGYGPQATANATILPIRHAGSAYPLPAAPAVMGVDGSRAIDGHGGILNDDVWYLAWTLATAHLRH